MNRQNHTHPSLSTGTSPVTRRGISAKAEEPPADSAGGFVSFARTLLFTTGITAVAGLLALTAAVAVVSLAPDPTAVARLAAYAALAVTALVGGIVAGRRAPDRPVLGALGAGAVFALLLTLLAIPVGHFVPAPDTLAVPDSLPTAGTAVSVAQAACMRLGVIVLHPIAAYLTRARHEEGETHAHHAGGHSRGRRSGEGRHGTHAASGHRETRR